MQDLFFDETIQSQFCFQATLSFSCVCHAPPRSACVHVLAGHCYSCVCSLLSTAASSPANFWRSTSSLLVRGVRRPAQHDVPTRRSSTSTLNSEGPPPLPPKHAATGWSDGSVQSKMFGWKRPETVNPLLKGKKHEDKGVKASVTIPGVDCFISCITLVTKERCATGKRVPHCDPRRKL